MKKNESFKSAIYEKNEKQEILLSFMKLQNQLKLKNILFQETDYKSNIIIFINIKLKITCNESF
jgi:hypothetical protein